MFIFSLVTFPLSRLQGTRHRGFILETASASISPHSGGSWGAEPSGEGSGGPTGLTLNVFLVLGVVLALQDLAHWTVWPVLPRTERVPGLTSQVP